MKRLCIRLAEKEDLSQIHSVYAYARKFMAESGNPNQWGTTHPPVETIEEDIKRRQLYVAVSDGAICGAFAFILGEDPTYGYIEGKWNSDEPYGTIHRIASNGNAHGMFSSCIDFCKDQISHLRIDTHMDNRIMQHLLTKHGFLYCGIIYLLDGNPRLAYDWHE